jgi:Trypsin
MSLRLLVTSLACFALLALPGQAWAVVGGTPDTAHPYVGLEDNGPELCSGTLVSSRVVVTAAHCYANASSRYGSADGHPRIRITFDQQGIFNPGRTSYLGTYYWDPQFCLGCAPGLPGFDTHDVAILVLDQSVSMPAYGRLPRAGLAAGLPTGTPLDLAGYGVQTFAKPEPCKPSCKPEPATYLTRFAAPASLIRVGDEFLTISANTAQGKGGQCSGDSGGPILLAGTDTLVAEVSHGSSNCVGVGYDYRLDTPQALGWIASAVAAYAR